MSWWNTTRKIRRKERKKQLRINKQLKKKLFGHLSIAPCYYCKVIFFLDELTIEHLIPLCLGGKNDHDNIALACQPCNNSRGKEAWIKRQQLNEQHFKQRSEQNRQGTLQESTAPTGDCEGQSM